MNSTQINKPAIFTKHISNTFNYCLLSLQFLHKQGHEMSGGESNYK